MQHRAQWAVPSVQRTGKAVLTIVTADEEAGKVLVGTADRSLTHLTPEEALRFADALREAAREADPAFFAHVSTADDDTTGTERALLDALRAFIASEQD